MPDGPEWVYEIKLDGYRALAINANGKPSLYARRRKSFNRRYRYIFDALHELPQNSVVDGEVVALDDVGRPNFNFLQHSKSQARRICYFVFDLLVYQNRDLTQLPLIERREILKSELKFQSRSGTWVKHRLNAGQELVVGSYFPGTYGVDAIIVGYYRGEDLIYVARVRNGFVPALRRQVFQRLRRLVVGECPSHRVARLSSLNTLDFGSPLGTIGFPGI